jgi:hypothetical protein
MKRLWILVLLALTASSCYKYTSPPAPVSAYKPILIDKQSLASSVKWLSSTDLNNPGKYLLNANYLYIVEKYKGVHVFDNTNPLSPQNMGLINVPGIQTISIKGNNLYADNATDIVALDISNPVSPRLLSRISNVLPVPGPPDGLPLDGPVAQSTWPVNSIPVDWVKLKN